MPRHGRQSKSRRDRWPHGLLVASTVSGPFPSRVEQGLAEAERGPAGARVNGSQLRNLAF